MSFLDSNFLSSNRIWVRAFTHTWEVTPPMYEKNLAQTKGATEKLAFLGFCNHLAPVNRKKDIGRREVKKSHNIINIVINVI